MEDLLDWSWSSLEGGHDPVQDDQREKQIIRLFAPILKARIEADRHPDAPPDAIYIPNGDPVEIKCSTKKGKSVSTAHGFTRRHLERFRTRHMIIAFGPNLVNGFRVERVFYSHPQVHLQVWLNTMTAMFDEHDQVIEYLMDRDLSQVRTAKVKKLRAQLELSLNDPQIPWTTIMGCVELRDPVNDLSRLITQYPPVTNSLQPIVIADGLITI